jgi:glycerol kinase
LVELAEQAIGSGLGELAVDGGAAASDPLLQAQADCTGLTVRRPASLESTARGVALFAGLQAGVISDLEQLATARRDGAELFHPQMDASQRDRWRTRWQDAVSRSLGWHG